MIWVYGKCALKIKAMQKEMATHSSILAWEIQGQEPGVLQSMGGGGCHKESDTTQQLNNKIERTEMWRVCHLHIVHGLLFFGLGEYLISIYRTIFFVGVFNIYRSLQIEKVT